MNGYWYGPYGYSTYTPIKPVSMDRYDDRLDVVTGMIREGIAGERSDELFYDYLISVAPTQQEKDVITSIRDDERKHRRLFRQLYAQLTGQRPGAAEEGEAFQRPASYLSGIEQALMGELKAFERYRTIYRHIPQQYRDTLFEIMTDELKHASYYNWLYAKNK
ncbi:ferritin-like domain-containing protein [Brevibacillus composti]|uniref:Ferritin-like domain-containing protein n=1 Tax=Brevibacillus composti TaxID=2796470 RepID=A0A7T5JMY8_9BACL|nr:ferritin-like domain-containing protein [Brevibacillus composti]QQE73592.1 ferritin-like domain-containing protein [Brevibacillus composti]QUO40674.1 ferritin-like domain-containing protein [Brevibacillus composti]